MAKSNDLLKVLIAGLGFLMVLGAVNYCERHRDGEHEQALKFGQVTVKKINSDADAAEQRLRDYFDSVTRREKNSEVWGSKEKALILRTPYPTRNQVVALQYASSPKRDFIHAWQN